MVKWQVLQRTFEYCEIETAKDSNHKRDTNTKDSSESRLFEKLTVKMTCCHFKGGVCSLALWEERALTWTVHEVCDLFDAVSLIP